MCSAWRFCLSVYLLLSPLGITPVSSFRVMLLVADEGVTSEYNRMPSLHMVVRIWFTFHLGRALIHEFRQNSSHCGALPLLTTSPKSYKSCGFNPGSGSRPGLTRLSCEFGHLIPSREPARKSV